jgi:hypothetical protein
MALGGMRGVCDDENLCGLGANGDKSKTRTSPS